MILEIKGMTLIEILAALSIFSMASISVLRSVNQHINTAIYLENQMFASLVAENKMAMLMLEPSQAKNQSGISIMGNRVWFWYAHLTPIEGTLQAIDVRVSLEKSSQPVFSVRGYVPKK